MEIQNVYDSYSQGVISMGEFKEEVLKYSYNRVKSNKYIEPGDFIIEMLPKTETIIKGYKPELSQFSGYLHRHIKWLCLQCNKNYIKERDRSEAINYHEKAEFKQSLVCEERAPKYRINNSIKEKLRIFKGVITKETTRKRVLILTLKNSRLVDEDILQRISKITGYNIEWLRERVTNLLKTCSERIKNREYLVHRSNRLFIEITKDQDRVLNEIDQKKKKEIIRELNEKRERLHSIQATLARRNYGPKNEDIARELNIPKGTVDSSLYYIKKELDSL